MRASVQRVLVICLAALIGIGVGGFAGYKLSLSFILGHAQRRIAEAADHATAELSNSAVEARSALAAIDASTASPCADAEIGQLRALIFQAHYLKEAGRIRNERVACSTSFGKLAAGAVLPPPDFIQSDRTEIYRNLGPFRIDGVATVSIRQGDAFVVFNPFGNSELNALKMKYAVTTRDAVNNTTGVVLGEAAPLATADLSRNTTGIKSGQVFATRCATVSPGCVTIYTPAAEIIENSQNVIVALVVMGAIAGGLLTIVCMQLWARKRGLPAQLVQAIKDDALTVVYQPIVDLETGCIVEAEALARWTDEQGNLVSPEVFINIAEERGFVGEITRLVVRRALLELGRTLRGRRDFRVSVNVAAQDLADAEFLPMLQQALELAGVGPESLGIEITESFTARQEVAKECIRRLRERGHHVAIDDFGTGYSSLAYLHDLSVDAIKIDKAFTRTIGTDAVTVSILPQILSIAANLGLDVTVEGIETEKQAHYFVDAPVKVRAQGWYYGYPSSAEELEHLLKDNVARPLASATRLGPAPVTAINSKR